MANLPFEPVGPGGLGPTGGGWEDDPIDVEPARWRGRWWVLPLVFTLAVLVVLGGFYVGIRLFTPPSTQRQQEQTTVSPLARQMEELQKRWQAIVARSTPSSTRAPWEQTLYGTDPEFCETLFRHYEVERFVEQEGVLLFGTLAEDVSRVRRERTVAFVRTVVTAVRENRVGPATACDFLLRERRLSQSPTKREFVEEAIAAVARVGLTPEEVAEGKFTISTDELRQLLIAAAREETAILRLRWRNGDENAAAQLRMFLSQYRFQGRDIGLNDWEVKRLQLVHYPD